jgi:hypothetical protein
MQYVPIVEGCVDFGDFTADSESCCCVKHILASSCLSPLHMTFARGVEADTCLV